MEELKEKRVKRLVSVKVTVTSQDEKEQIIRLEILFGGKRQRVDNFIKISPDTLWLTCCNSCHITLEFPNADRPKCQLCTESHTTRNHKCDVRGYHARAGRDSKYTNFRCTNCRATYYTTSTIYPTHRQDFIIV